jgi:hypothetical protein
LQAAAVPSPEKYDDRDNDNRNGDGQDHSSPARWVDGRIAARAGEGIFGGAFAKGLHAPLVGPDDQGRSSR